VMRLTTMRSCKGRNFIWIAPFLVSSADRLSQESLVPGIRRQKASSSAHQHSPPGSANHLACRGTAFKERKELPGDVQGPGILRGSRHRADAGFTLSSPKQEYWPEAGCPS